MIVCEHNRFKIEERLRKANGRAGAFTVTTCREVIDITNRAGKILKNEFGISRKNWRGARFSYVPAGPKNHSYKYDAISTKVTIECWSTGWALIDAERFLIKPAQEARRWVILTPAQDSIARAWFAAKYDVNESL